ncbi:DUF2062 domain-containing protein [Pseudomarimonas salicorniae]|uniref:DUF2062 domain-containing protein n=1 Tax=Pseudomarimonas salicorniae TaxID=2933270 RepID=A0ABT0GD47_9GAMM|nr:DUF2062 domain-containing protein [Lysobacter sp. CAU 1642]MCK7592466.1 DUF2062 domain-containing protein [Lysobacter sp. CAU 1642]
MSEEYERHFRELLARRRRLRKLLKPLPRRANVRRYPVLKWFARQAAARPYLWSFRRENVLPAIYMGSVVSLLPLYGVQLVVAVVLAIWLRANLTVTVALQFITNPFTIAPIYLFTTWVGVQLMEAMSLGESLPRAIYVTNALMIGGVVVGLIVALLCDLGWRFLAWEARRFRNRLAAHRIHKEMIQTGRDDSAAAGESS